jgi:hypothetical protein
MSIYDQFMEDAIFDAEYQDYLYHQQKQKNEMLDYLYRIEQQAYDIMCEQANKDQEFYETCMEEKEYRSISEWDFIKEMVEIDYI